MLPPHLCRGSTELKEPRKAGPEFDEEQQGSEHSASSSPRWAQARGLRLAVFSRFSGLVMGTIFLMFWLAHVHSGQAALQRSAVERVLMRLGEWAIGRWGFENGLDELER